MKLFSKKPSRAFIIIIVIILSPFALLILAPAGNWAWDNTVERKYQDPDFQSYYSAHQYCSSFYQGSDKSQEEIYQAWLNDEEIGC